MWESNIINMKWVSLYIVCSIMLGAYVPKVVAIEVARNIYIKHEDLHGEDKFSIGNVETIENEGNKLIYIFHLDPVGFIMVPADDRAVPNLAFGFEHSFESKNLPPNLNALINQYKTELKALIDNQ